MLSYSELKKLKSLNFDEEKCTKLMRCCIANNIGYCSKFANDYVTI